MSSNTFRFGDWIVEPQLNRIHGADADKRLEPLSMDILVHLLKHPGETVSVDQLLEAVWPGRVVEPTAVHRGVNHIRRALGDDPHHPRYIETIRKRGYRAIAAVSSIPNADGDSRESSWTQRPEEPESLHVLAVMPFDDLSPHADQQWLADGLTEELTDSLSRIETLRVIARNSTSSLKERKATISEIGSQLGVTSLVIGSIKRFSDRVTVSVRWIRVRDQHPMWVARYERTLNDVLDVQREIAIGIAEAIRKELGIRERIEFIARGRYRISDLRAWEAFRRGVNLLTTFLPSKMAEGREYLRQALDIDPDYLDARAWLAWSEFDRPKQRNESAIRVLEQQPTNPVALLSLIADCEAQWDYRTAESLWRFAVLNNPLDSQLPLEGFHLCSCLGALEEALEVAQQGVRLDPLFPQQQFFLGLAHLNLGNPTSAIEPIRRAITLNDQMGDVVGQVPSWPYQYLAIAYQGAGCEPEAINALLQGFPRYREEISNGVRNRGWRGANLALSKIVTESREMHPLDRLARRRYRAPFLASAGEKELMYEQLSKLMDETAEYAVRDREAMRNSRCLSEYLRANAEFQPYWEESEFRSLKQRLDDRIARSAGTAGYSDLIR